MFWWQVCTIKEISKIAAMDSIYATKVFMLVRLEKASQQTYIQIMLQLLYLKHSQISALELLETESNHQQR